LGHSQKLRFREPRVKNGDDAPLVSSTLPTAPLTGRHRRFPVSPLAEQGEQAACGRPAFPYKKSATFYSAAFQVG